MTDEQRRWLLAMTAPTDPADRGARRLLLPLAYIRDLLGVDLTPDGDPELRSFFLSWLRKRTRNPDLRVDDAAPLGLLETFLDDRGLCPRKFLAARWGMSDASFAWILDACGDLELRRNSLEAWPGVVTQNASALLAQSADDGGRIGYADDPGRRFELADEVFAPVVGRRLERLTCRSPEHGSRGWRDAAATFCRFTLRPLCFDCARSFDFVRSVRRFPDQVDVAFYLENRDDLRPYKFGRWLDEPLADGLARRRFE